MNHHHRLLSLPRSSSCKSTTSIIPSTNYISSTSSFFVDPSYAADDKSLVETRSPVGCFFFRTHIGLSSFLRSILSIVPIPAILPSCRRWLTLPNQLSSLSLYSPARKVTGTLFGNRRGHVSFAVQHDPRSEPLLIVELSLSTASLVKEMSSGFVRIALECEKHHARQVARGSTMKLFHEPTWSMYCNGRKCGYAQSRACTASDWHVLSMVQTVSVGAGVIPVVDDGCRKRNGGEGELLYMRAKFERVVGSRDSEAFYMMNPDGSTGGPELSIFLLRI